MMVAYFVERKTMASHSASLFVKHLSSLSHLVIGGVSAFDIFNSWMASTHTQDLYARLMVFKSFMVWVDENCYTYDKWCGEIVTRWEEYLKSKGNKASTITVKMSNVRQVLLSAQNEGIIPVCVYYQRRGRKPKNQETRLVFVQENKAQKPKAKKATINNVKKDGKIDRTFLYTLFGLGEDFTSNELKQAFKRVAMLYHPDQNTSEVAADQFRACREIYTFLSDYETRSLYEDFTHQKRGRPNTTVMSFVTSMQSLFVDGQAVCAC